MPKWIGEGFPGAGDHSPKEGVAVDVAHAAAMSAPD
jgi:hypothetical protein